jgi:hypothetical protein
VNASPGGVPNRVRPFPFARAQALVVSAALILAADLGILLLNGPAARTPFTQATARAVDETMSESAAARPSGDTSRAAPPLPAEVRSDQAAQPQPAPPPPAQPAEPRITLVQAGPRLAAYAGLSTWIDLWDTSLTAEQQVDRAAAAGVQTIFVQSARFNSPADIHDPRRLSTTIDRAKRYGLKVMVWYIPDFLDEARDLRRSQAAISFVSEQGNRADSFGLDIEMEKLPDVAERSARLIRLSQRLREWVGPEYPMSAIVLPPLQLDMRPTWWPNFPWQGIAPYYDVWVPMSYSSFRGRDADTTYRWNLQNIIETRIRVGDPNLPIHMAGGIADNLPNVDAFVRAVNDGLTLGGGLYDLHTTRPEAWPVLRQMRAER